MAKLDWNPEEYKDDSRGNFKPFPAGEYTLKAIEAEEKATSTGGTMIKAKYEVVKGEHAGRYVWHNFNVENKSKEAEKIGRKELFNWFRAAGKPNCRDTDLVIEVPFRAMIKIKPAEGNYPEGNEIHYFINPDEGEEAPAATTKAATNGAGKSEETAEKPTPKADTKPANKPAATGGGRKNHWDD
jgi:hypothetical protein